MRFALRNKTKLINAFGEAYYNELIASINSFQSNYTPDCHYWNEAIQKEMLDMPSSTHPDKTFSFAIVSEMWDTCPVVTVVSQATLPFGSCSRIASRIASEI